MNQTVYKNILRRFMRHCVTRGGPFWEAHAWRLHHINTPNHTALSIGQFFAERNIVTLKYPPYSLDLTLCDFFLFPKIKSVLKRTHFSDIDSIKMAATTELKKIPENAFQGLLNPGKGECTSVSKWKEITLKEFDFGIFQDFSIKFL